MDRKVWTAAELEKMIPAERKAISDAAVVTDLNEAPTDLVENARAFVEARIRAEDPSTTVD